MTEVTVARRARTPQSNEDQKPAKPPGLDNHNHNALVAHHEVRPVVLELALEGPLQVPAPQGLHAERAL